MFGLFKKKNADGSEKLPGPKTIPDPVGSTLVVQFKEDPTWAWALKAVIKPKEEKDVFDIRVFSDSTAGSAKVSVKDYHSLDDHPNLILYDGIYDKKKKKAQLQQRYKKTD
jgi:hypothetical protein